MLREKSALTPRHIAGSAKNSTFSSLYSDSLQENTDRVAIPLVLLETNTITTLPLRKNLLGLKRKPINNYFAFILQVL